MVCAYQALDQFLRHHPSVCAAFYDRQDTHGHSEAVVYEDARHQVEEVVVVLVALDGLDGHILEDWLDGVREFALCLPFLCETMRRARWPKEAPNGASTFIDLHLQVIDGSLKLRRERTLNWSSVACCLDTVITDQFGTSLLGTAAYTLLGFAFLVLSVRQKSDRRVFSPFFSRATRPSTVLAPGSKYGARAGYGLRDLE
jgi:hypothetical protein